MKSMMGMAGFGRPGKGMKGLRFPKHPPGIDLPKGLGGERVERADPARRPEGEMVWSRSG